MMEELSNKDIDKIVRHSYQYVTMYNVIHNFATNLKNPIASGGLNKVYRAKEFADHNVRVVPRPNNDSLYVHSLLDLCN